MRVLWFANAPANAMDYLPEYLRDKVFGGGWLKSVDKAIQNHVELHIAFYYPKRNDSFRYLNTTYHPIGHKNWKLASIKEIFLKKFLDRQDLSRYLQIIDLVKPDIIHIHGTENPFGCIIDKTKIPVVTSIQGDVNIIHHKYFSGIEQKYLKTGRPLNLGLKELILGKNFRHNYKEFHMMKKREERNLLNAKFVIGRTDWDERVTSVQAPGSKYFHVDEILRDSFYNSRWFPRKPDGQLIIHTTTSNSYFKGLETLCRALYELKKLGIIVDWRIAGLNENDLIVKVVKRKLKNLYPDKGLKFLGKLSEQQLVEKLLEADIYVTSSHIENSSNSLCEAMSLGMPCIATFAGGTGSILKNGEEGILIQDGDPWALAGSIIEMFENPLKGHKYGTAARSSALKRHDREKIVNSLLNVYESMLKTSY